MPRSNRIHQLILIGSMIPLSWLGMMAVHEFGHVVGAWCTGGTVIRVVLHPLAISRTDVSPNPHPLLVVWAGPMIGVLLPLFAFGVATALRAKRTFLVRFFVGFCLVANGVYIGAGAFQGLADAGDMLRHGSEAWQLWVFGTITVPLGILLWNGQGEHFGLGEARGKVDPIASCALAILLAALVSVGLLAFD